MSHGFLIFMFVSTFLPSFYAAPAAFLASAES